MYKPGIASRTFDEFFAGSGMVRAGLGDSWTCLFANDFDNKKAGAYQENWGNGELLVADVGRVRSRDLPGRANLAWASFPCQDLSLAGMGAGLKGKRSGTFWPVWDLMCELRKEGRQPEVVVLENVCGALTSHDGEDFRSLINALGAEGYRNGALVIDAALFVPQSRPRLFIVGVREDIKLRPSLASGMPQAPFHTSAIIAAYNRLPTANRTKWVWWNLPVPAPRTSTFSSVIQGDIPWDSCEQTEALLSLMLPLHRAKIAAARKTGKRMTGAIVKRTRADERGRRPSEPRCGSTSSGCSRTPGGGSSRQTIIVVHGDKVRSRLLSPREAARLMGLPDEYILPRN